MNSSVHGIYHQKSVRKFQHCLYRICKSLFDSRLHDQTVYHDLDIMFDIFVQADFFGKFVHISVNLYTDITASFRMFQKFGMSTLASTHNRSQKLEFRAFRKGHDRIYHLVNSLFLNLSSAFRTVRDSDSGVQQTKVVVNLRDSSYCGTWIAVGGFLVNGNRRRKSLYALHIRFLHLPEELPRIGRQRFHIASLSFCINRIKCQR